MSRSPERSRSLAFSMVVLGFLAELAGIGLLAAGRRTPAALAVMIVGLMMVVGAMVLIASGRKQEK